jgi:hypothetical protein
MFRFTLSQQDFATVMKALSALPLGESLQAFMNLQNQLAKQQAEAQAAQGIPPAAQQQAMPPAAPLPNGQDVLKKD